MSLLDTFSAAFDNPDINVKKPRVIDRASSSQGTTKSDRRSWIIAAAQRCFSCSEVGGCDNFSRWLREKTLTDEGFFAALKKSNERIFIQLLMN